MVLSSIKKEAGVFCCAYGCNEEPQTKKGGLCHKHYARKLRERDPVGVRYNNIVQNAKRRGKLVFFNLEEFRQWCKKTGYLSKGDRGFAWTLDRRCNAHDYHLWNIQKMTNRANARKGSSFSGAVFSREHHFGKPPENWSISEGEIPF